MICLDSHFLIWGIKQQATSGQEDMVGKTLKFFEWLEEEGESVIIPAPIITELLVRVPADKHAEFLTVIQETFQVVPFDTAAAVLCAKMWAEKKDNQELKKYREENSITREEMKYDFQIVSVAVTRGCKAIYSYDKPLAKFADGYIDVRQIPSHIGAQTEMKFET